MSEVGDGHSSGATSRRSPGFRTGLLVVLLVVLVLAAASVAYLSATRAASAFGISGVGGEQDNIQADREQVMSQAEQFMIRINTYGPDLLQGDEMPEYRKRVEQVITAKFAADFEKNVPAAEATVKQAQVARSATVYSTGVSAIDSDSATALVAGSFLQSYPESTGSDKRVQTEPSPFRVTVELVKIKGTWLVDDFSPVADPDADSTGSSSSAAPSDSPSDGASSPSSGLPSEEPTTAPTGSGTGPGTGSKTPSSGASQ